MESHHNQFILSRSKLPQMEGLKNPLHCPTCPTDRRKSRAKLLKARRLSLHTAHQTVSAVGHISKDGTATECNIFGSSGDDKKASRKLRNRASALASRNKRSEEIESLTYRLGKCSPTTLVELIKWQTSLTFHRLPGIPPSSYSFNLIFYRTNDRRNEEIADEALQIRRCR